MTLAQNMKNWTEEWLLDNELVRIWNKADVQWFKRLSTQVHWWTQQDVEYPQQQLSREESKRSFLNMNEYCTLIIVFGIL